MTLYSKDFEEAVRIGRPPNITSLFPNSRALLVSGKYIDNAMIRKGRCMTIAANARSHIIIRGVLLAAQRANAAIIIEIARSEGGIDAYCPVSLWNMARQVDAIANELKITVPIAIHADHYGIKKESDLPGARKEIPSLFEAGITSIAIDASHMPDDLNLLSNLAVADLIPYWAGLETEVGEIKGNQGLSTPEEALFLIQGLNAHNIFPNWIALNNGTTHGIEANRDGIQIELTAAIHKALLPYKIS
ncbi:class II fructose-bisphosphate aldolase, partial [Desulfococcaceae bacterium OttesenSCG-928-F15]|nr:class II fructose-bisphosphate aldolase [Desulfococcaceae bacterium OttesenSCG-928-F15]